MPLILGAAADPYFPRNSRRRARGWGSAKRWLSIFSGEKSSGKLTIKNHYPAIIKRCVFRTAQERLLERKMENRKPQQASYPLSGVLRCGHCGGPLSGVSSRKYRYYHCFNAANGLCVERRVRAERVEGLLCDFARDALLADEHRAAPRESLARKVTGAMKASSKRSRVLCANGAAC